MREGTHAAERWHGRLDEEPKTQEGEDTLESYRQDSG